MKNQTTIPHPHQLQMSGVVQMRAAYIALFCCFAIFITEATAQSVIVRVSGGESYFYYPPVNNHDALQTVIFDALNGDTIYLPGTTYTLEASIVFNKGLVVIGSGIHPDSTGTSGRTVFTSFSSLYGLQFATGANGLEFHGIVYNGAGAVQAQNTTTAVNNLKFIRCEINRLRLGTASSFVSLSTNILVRECVINILLDVDNANFVNIQNSFISNIDRAGVNCTIESCILLDFNQAGGATVNSGALFKNNIITRNISAAYTVNESCIFQNNLWVGQAFFELSFSSNVTSASNNLYTNNIANVFIDAPNLTTFSYVSNYNLVTGTYQTMGISGGPVGVYGGPSPLKPGMLPFNPHWQILEMPGATSGGTLQGVYIKAAAQTN